MPSPQPLARDADLNPEENSLRHQGKIHFPRVFEVFSWDRQSPDWRLSADCPARSSLAET
jgi:hypothetical protein